jgi:hypothetical protein
MDTFIGDVSITVPYESKWAGKEKCDVIQIYEELHNLHSLPNTIRVVISRGIRLAGHVECTDLKYISCESR